MKAIWIPALLLLTVPQQPAQALDLTAVVKGRQIVLSWPQCAVPVATAEAAILSIKDSGRHEAVQLNLDVVRDGRIAYNPIGDDVIFHLVIHDFTHGRAATGSTRVIIRGVRAPRPMPPARKPSLIAKRAEALYDAGL